MSVSFVYVYGQTTKTVKVSYSPNDFSITHRDSVIYITSQTLTCTYSEDTLAPALPYLGINVLIGNDMEYESHSISYTESTILDNALIAPNPASVPTNNTSPFQRTSYADYNRAIYPDTIVNYTGSHIIGGYKLLTFSICPFKYDVINRKLSLITGITINLSLSTDVVGNKHKTNHNRNVTESIKRMVINPQDISQANGFRSSTQNDEYEYLIITVDSFKSEFQRLADWKTTKGVRAKVMTVEEIDSATANSQWSRPQQKIKNTIMNCYNASNHSLQYVLLAGDHQFVPTEHCYNIKTYKNPETQNNDTIETDIAADLYYASLKEVNWDKNYDGKIGAVSDHVDFANDIIVTRLSVNSVLDARHQINRLIEYESCPNTDDWEEKILLGGVTLNEHYYYYPDINATISDTHYKCERYLYPNYIQPYWQNGTKYMFYDTGTSFAGGKDYQFRVGHVQEQFTNKYTFYNVVAHGHVGDWKMEWRNDSIPQLQYYYSSDALAMHNSGYTIITTSACDTNGFSNDTTECLGESFMRNTNGGIIGYYGCTNKGWAIGNATSENYSEKHVGYMYRALFTDNHHQIGRAVYDAKREFINMWNDSTSAERWLCIGMNLLGDPEMPVFLSQPLRFNNVSLSYHNHILSVNTNTSNCRICITSKDDFGESYYEVIDSLSSYSFTLPSGAYRLCIFKYGYIPYIVTIADNLYVQDETFSSDTNIFANQVYVGSHVTNEKPQGPVTISSGAVKINSSNGVEIVNDFQVQQGATLEINP